MLPKTILPPKPTRIETIEDVRNWMEAWNKFFENFYNQLCAQFQEFDRVTVRGDDGSEVHGFYTQHSEMKL